MIFGIGVHRIELLCVYSEVLDVLKELLPYLAELVIQNFVFRFGHIMQSFLTWTHVEKLVCVDQPMVFFQHHWTFIQYHDVWNSEFGVDNCLDFLL